MAPPSLRRPELQARQRGDILTPLLAASGLRLPPPTTLGLILTPKAASGLCPPTSGLAPGPGVALLHALPQAALMVSGSSPGGRMCLRQGAGGSEQGQVPGEEASGLGQPLPAPEQALWCPGGGWPRHSLQGLGVSAPTHPASQAAPPSSPP